MHDFSQIIIIGFILVLEVLTICSVVPAMQNIYNPNAQIKPIQQAQIFCNTRVSLRKGETRTLLAGLSETRGSYIRRVV